MKGYRKKGLRLLFRGDAAFGKPEVYEYLRQARPELDRLSCHKFVANQVRLGLFILGSVFWTDFKISFKLEA